MDNYGGQIYTQMTLTLSLVCCDMMNSINCRICLYVNWNKIDVAILLQFSCILATSVPPLLLLHLLSKSYMLLSECCLHKIVSPFYPAFFMMLPSLNTFTSWSCNQIMCTCKCYKSWYSYPFELVCLYDLLRNEICCFLKFLCRKFVKIMISPRWS